MPFLISTHPFISLPIGAGEFWVLLVKRSFPFTALKPITFDIHKVCPLAVLDKRGHNWDDQADIHFHLKASHVIPFFPSLEIF